MKRPSTKEAPEYYNHYIDLVKSDDVIKELKDQVLKIQAIISEIPEDKENYAYADGKWTIKQVIGHIIDTERVFGYRAMCFARKDKTALPGFDENAFVANSNFHKRTLYELGHEFAIVREANLTMFKTFEEEELSEMGNANGKDVSVRAVIFMVAGHAIHHLNVLKTKYLLEL
ncbi:MAG: hypothetical protein K0S44_1632 [Bacteroidetes bacterium]|jgi:uncharacterized damage-inducible protein DinB|nr:hypothetical protein [Bacteroidota bacterium]